MPRNYAGGTDAVVMDIGLAATDTFDVFTLMAVGKITNNATAHTTLAAVTSGGSTKMYFYPSSAAELEIDGGAGGFAHSPLTMTSSDGWCVFGVTKTTGTVAPVFHKCVLSTGTWTHTTANGGSSSGQISAPGSAGAGGSWWVGANNDGGAEPYVGDLAAAAYWNIAMTNTEVERLARGRWFEADPRFLVEYPDGPDRVGRSVRDISRGQGRQSSVTGTTRSTTGPPGFRYSIRGRRM